MIESSKYHPTEFNKFDICEAYYRFAMEYHNGQWSEEYAIFGRLSRMQFSPGRSTAEAPVHAWESYNAQNIYYNLVRKALGRN